MKLKLQRETLLKPLQQVINVVERKQTLPILSNVLLYAKDGKISVTGTDLEVELVGKADMQDQAEDTQQFTLPGKKLIDICKALPESAPIELYQEKERMILKSGRSRFTLATLPAQDFPNIEHQEGHIHFRVQQGALKDLLSRVQFAMAQQDVRYYLNGMLIEICANELRAVATDGHRLAMMHINTPSINVDHRVQIIVPRKGILELQRLLDDSDDDVDLTISSNHIRAQTENCIFTSKLIDGRFPDYKRVVPKNNDKTIIVNRSEFKQALSRTAILCNEKFHGIRLEFQKNALKMSANNPEQEAAEEELQIEYNENSVEIGFNVTYLLDILNTVSTDEIKLEIKDANSSMVIEECNNDSTATYVVMPMRL